MANIKTVTYKFCLLIVLLVGFNFLYKKYLYESDLQKYSDDINTIRDIVNQKNEIIYVGDSSDSTFRENDLDKRSISSFIADYYPSIKMASLSMAAYHASIYYELLRNISDSASVKTIIVTLNLRSFDANWIYSDLETPLQKRMVLLKYYPPLFNRFMLSFKGYDIKTSAERTKQVKAKWKNDILHFNTPTNYKNVIEWDGAMFHNGIKNADGTKNNKLTELACHYIKTYAFEINTNTNPRIKDFDKIVALAKARKWNIILNLMAENTEKADSLVGQELIHFIKQNRDLLMKRYNKNNVMVIDNLECVPTSEYIDIHWTTEHYAENGRKIIAKNVANALKSFYQNEYRELK